MLTFAKHCYTRFMCCSCLTMLTLAKHLSAYLNSDILIPRLFNTKQCLVKYMHVVLKIC